MARIADDPAVPEPARAMFAELGGRIAELSVRLTALDRDLARLHKSSPVSQLLAEIPGIGPIGAVSFALKVSDPKAFRSGRHFAAWLGLTPKENATGGRSRPGRISRQGDQILRRLLVLGATTVIQCRQSRGGSASAWLIQLLARRPRKLAAVALANKMARILWAMITWANSTAGRNRSEPPFTELPGACKDNSGRWRSVEPTSETPRGIEWSVRNRASRAGSAEPIWAAVDADRTKAGHMTASYPSSIRRSVLGPVRLDGESAEDLTPGR